MAKLATPAATSWHTVEPCSRSRKTRSIVRAKSGSPSQTARTFFFYVINIVYTPAGRR